MRRRWLIDGMAATALAVALGGGGCSVLPSQPFLQRRDWPMEVRRPGDLTREVTRELPGASPGGAPAQSRMTPPSRPDGRVLLVRTVQAGPELATRGMQTVQQDGSLATAFYEEWAVPPAEGIDDDLRRWLVDSGRFAAVLAPGGRIASDLVLEPELITLHADLGSMTASAALELVLIDQRRSVAQIRLQRTEAASVKLEGTDPPAQVRAQLAAVEAVLRQTETDLADALRP